MGNDFYSLWLDDSMTYSSAIFNKQTSNLNEAQLNKYKNLCELSKLNSDTNILEIGCGWGGFAEYAAKSFGSKVTGITLSEEQANFAKKRIFRKGLNELVDIKIIDYRDLKDKFDRIISIGVIIFYASVSIFFIFLNQFSQDIFSNISQYIITPIFIS